MSKIVFTDLARADLLEAWEYVAERSLSAADRLLLTINDDIHTLAKQPLMGRERPELRVGLRSWPTSTAYILYYVPDQDGLILVRVLHHARDIQPLGAFH
jgi:plasmid stabilization system protein ParE